MADIRIDDNDLDEVEAKVKATQKAVESISLAAAAIKQTVVTIDTCVATAGFAKAVGPKLTSLATALEKIEPTWQPAQKVLDQQLAVFQELRQYQNTDGLGDDIAKAME